MWTESAILSLRSLGPWLQGWGWGCVGEASLLGQKVSLGAAAGRPAASYWGEPASREASFLQAEVLLSPQA